MVKFILFFTSISLFLLPLTATGCPCGCAVAGPMNFVAANQFRTTSHITIEQINGSFDSDGDHVQELGPNQIWTWTNSLGYSLDQHHSIAMTLPSHMNLAKTQTKNTSIGDPSIGLLKKISTNYHANNYFTSYSISLNYKLPLAKGMTEQSTNQEYLDIHGNGFHEFMAGFHTTISDYFIYVKPSFGLLLRNSRYEGDQFKKRYREPGVGYRSELGFSYNFIGKGEIGAGIQREFRTRSKIDGIEYPESATLSHTGYMSASTKLAALTNLSLIISKKGFDQVDYTSTKFISAKIGLEKTF